MKEKILRVLKKKEWPVTTEDIAKELNISWNTAQIYLFKLVVEGKVKYKKVGRQNQFWLDKKYRQEF